jgi:hypothetical protein
MVYAATADYEGLNSVFACDLTSGQGVLDSIRAVHGAAYFIKRSFLIFLDMILILQSITIIITHIEAEFYFR